MEIKGISKKYCSQNKIETLALDNVTYTFPTKGIVFIVGKSGCGKTTLLNLLGGIDSVTNGEIMYLGNKLDFTHKTLDSFRSNEVSFIFQNYNLIAELTNYDNLRIADSKIDKAEFDSKIRIVLEKVNLSSDILKKYPKELSGGQQQRLAVVRALIKPHNIIIADEPTGNLDSNTSEDIFNLLKEQSSEKLVIVVTHDVENAQIYADEIIRLEDGKIVDSPNKSAVTKDIIKKDLSKPNRIKSEMVMKLSFLNFRKNLLLVMLAMVLCVMAVSMISHSRAVGNFDLKKNTILSLEDNNINSYAIEGLNLKSNLDNLYNFYYGNETNLYRQKHYSQNSVNVYGKLNELFEEKYGDLSYNHEVSQGYIIVNNAEELVDMFGNQPIEYDSNGIFITDIYAQFLVGEQYSIDKINKQELLKEEDLIGNYISSSRYEYTKVIGIIKTNFYDYFNNYLNLSGGEYSQFDFDILYKAFHYYGSEEYLLENPTLKTALNASSVDSISISNDNKSVNVDRLSSSDRQDNSYIITSDGVVKSLDIEANDVIVDLYTYNVIKGTNYSANDVIDFEMMTTKIELDFSEKLILDVSSEYKIYKLENMKIVGVTVSPHNLGYQDINILMNDEQFNTFGFSYNRTIALIAQNINYEELDELWEVEGFKIDAPYKHELEMYSRHGTELNKNYLYTSIILTIFFVILMYFIMNNIIMSNMKNIGVLRSLGISKGQCINIFVIFSLLLSAIIIAVSAIVIPIWIYFSNIQMATVVREGARILRYDFTIIFSIIFLPIITSIFSSIIPLIKLSEMKPIDVINKG